ncbi:hypothetical protein ACWCYY_18815 [Kitasatospora sp. NPDC001664]
MTGSKPYQDELDYLVAYARDAPVYFFVVRGAAETLAGHGTHEDVIRALTVRLIGDMMDRGVAVGDLGGETGIEVEPWPLSKGDTLERIRREMNELDACDAFIRICWFRSHRSP